MKIELCRIDDRFIHGQVLTRWLKQVTVDRIIIVNDEVATDEMRKTLVLSVAPANVKASAVTVEKMARVWNNPKYEKTKAMLLFSNPSDILKLTELGVNIETVNVGGIRFSNERIQVTKSVSVSNEDIEACEGLNDKGVKLELRQLPDNSPQDFYEVMKKSVSKGE